jgi:hypothetical protein
MYWKIYRKNSGVQVAKVWYPFTTDTQEVFEAESDNFDFDILIASDSED